MSLSTSKKTWIRRSTFRGLSIQQRLPLLICVLLLCVMLSFAWISYIGVRKAALKSGTQRLSSLTDQLSTMFSQTTQAAIVATKGAASTAAIKKCLQTMDTASCAETFRAFEKMRLDSSSVLIDLLNVQHQHLIRSGKGGIERKVDFDNLFLPKISDTSTIGKIYKVRDSMYYPIITGVNDNNKLIGYIVRWRLITATPQAIAQFSQLLGTNATLYIGNTDRSLWTDMLQAVDNPVPENAVAKNNILEYSRKNGYKLLASEKTINNTSWILLIEFSQKEVMAPARNFLALVILIGAILVAIGSFIAWMMSRNITRPLNQLIHAVTSFAGGHDTAAVQVNRRDEVGKLARAFNAMQVQVQKGKQDLVQKVKEAEEMSQQMRGLSAHLQNIREQERIHIAREMHDELGQLLTGFKMDVAWLNRRMANNNDPAIQEKLESLLHIVDEAVSFVRKLSSELRPSILDDLGLLPALEWHSREFQKRFGIEVELNSMVQDLQTTELIATGLFRMYQESLTNVARHSGASKVTATLQKTSSQICLSITDNGKGFSVNGERKTLGLLGMKERAVMIGGKLEILSEEGKGTTVIITVPVAVAKEISV